jgi:hypothetical protein
MLARKISRSKWEPKPYLPPDAIRADAVTGCLRTNQDRLSLWRCVDDSADIDHVFLALATAPQVKSIETMDVVLLGEGDLSMVGLEMEDTDGETAVTDLRSRHVDVVALDLPKLGACAGVIAAQVADERVVRITKARLRRLVVKAIDAGRIVQSKLDEKLRADLQKNADSS